MINLLLLNEPINRYILAKPEDYLGTVMRRLTEANGEAWWHLVVELGERRFAATQFKTFSSLARVEGNVIFNRSLGSLIERVPIPEVRVVEQTEIGTEAAKDLADESPGQVLVVTQSGEFFRILFRGKAGGSVEDGSLLSQFQKALAQIPLAEAPPDLESISKPEASPEEPVSNQSSKKTARFLNACLTDANHNQIIKPSFNIAVKTEYALRVDIGPLSLDSGVVNPGIFDSDLLPHPETSEGWWLEAIVISNEFVVEKKRYPFFLPLHGTSWVCTCQPGGTHTCKANERTNHLFISIHAPADPGCKSLRLTIYFRKNAVESLMLTAQVSQNMQEGEGYRLVTDYRLTARLDSVDFLPQRSASILVNQHLNGTHCLVINGQTDEPLYFSLGDDTMRKATKKLRTQLEKIHYSKSGLIGIKNNYDQNNAKPKKEFIQDLADLAEKGWELYDAISNKIDFSLEEPGTIQIARAATEFVFPWAFIYDIEKESFAAWQPCQLLQNWDGKSTLVPEGARLCPHEKDHTTNTLCPFGFWGYRHILELPASINLENTDKIRQVIHRPGQLDFIFIQNTTLDPEITAHHINVLRKSMGNAWEPITKRQEAKYALTNPEPEIIYFYVHGKKLEEDSLALTSLLVGNDEEIQTSDIKAWYKSEWKANPNHWNNSSPLIFINGCHTADLLPDSPVSFVDEFSRAAAAGVVGTEITISQRVASEMAETFLAYFVKQIPAGEALRLARLNLLNKGNLLGLVYAAYCAADLSLD